MERPASDLYDSYLRAIQYLNAQVDGKCGSDVTRAMLRMKTISRDAFIVWWAQVSIDDELKSRWLSRFDDPVAYYERICAQITEQLDQIPIPRTAA